VGGEHVDVEVLIEPGVDPHTFETTPGDARALAGADLVLINGLGLDDFLVDDVQGANDDVPVAIVSEGVELLEAGGQAHDEHPETDGHDHGGLDPHIWQDPLRAKVMVANIAAALAEVDPANAETYRSNADAYSTTLDETHVQIQALIDEIPEDNRKLVTNHDAFAYFADRYGLEVVGTVIPGSSSEADPSAGEIAGLVELIEREGVDAIFTETLLDPQVAERLAADAGVDVIHGLYSDQVGEEGSGAQTLHEMLVANARKISEALR
jgi:ABC-type Zn uptake system ZnuABC Zn-binding protein ZnuA